jgi:hypothetical protein
MKEVRKEGRKEKAEKGKEGHNRTKIAGVLISSL